jgi:hypothetical protein
VCKLIAPPRPKDKQKTPRRQLFDIPAFRQAVLAAYWRAFSAIAQIGAYCSLSELRERIASAAADRTTAVQIELARAIGEFDALADAIEERTGLRPLRWAA